MEYLQQLRKLLGSHYWYTGFRLTVAVVTPALILFHFGLLASMMSIPLGALCVGLTDSPGPYHHKKNSLIASIIFNFFVALISGWLHSYTGLVYTEIIVFGMFFSLIGIYGSRVNAIGLIALLVFVFNIDGHSSSQNILISALWFSLGGAWYALLSLLSYRLRPYRLIQQLLGESLGTTASYLKVKASFYLPGANYNLLYQDLNKIQVSLQETQEELREILFKTRQLATESTAKGRILMLLFIESIDLFERIMTSQQDYEKLHREFDSTGILEKYYRLITALSDELQAIGLSVQEGNAAKQGEDTGKLFLGVLAEFEELRKNYLSPDTIEGLIRLRQILHYLDDVRQRIHYLKLLTSYDKNLVSHYHSPEDLDQFVTHREIDPELLRENLSLKSSQFRHAIRLTLALLLGYTVSLIFPIGHGYWILLTITLIIKPSYSITRQRNRSRLLGTLIGAAAGFLILFFIQEKTLLFLIMLAAMLISYSMLKLNYFISVIGITIYVLFSLYFLNPGGFQLALVDRITDTVLGSLIAILVSSTVLPFWEHKQSREYILNALKANQSYFSEVGKIFNGRSNDITLFKLSRKNAFVSLANLGDHFQRLLSEPKTRQPHLEEYHQFVATSHMLTSYIASLSFYAHKQTWKTFGVDFQPVVETVEEQFQQVVGIMEGLPVSIAGESTKSNPLKEKVSELLLERKTEIRINDVKAPITGVRKNLSELKTISDQFDLISTIVQEEGKILKKLDSVEKNPDMV